MYRQKTVLSHWEGIFLYLDVLKSCANPTVLGFLNSTLTLLTWSQLLYKKIQCDTMKLGRSSAVLSKVLEKIGLPLHLLTVSDLLLIAVMPLLGAVHTHKLGFLS